VRRIVLCLAASLAVMLSWVPLASASVDIRKKWRNCDTNKAGLSFRTEFQNPASWYGTGKYLIKSQIRWDKYASGMWRKLDANTIQTPWTKITNLQYDFGLSHGDRTDWGFWFPKRWRAHVVVKLIKNRPGPKDKRVDTVERWFEKPQFNEVGSCGDGVSIGT
jgi:hypothetical protein